MIAPTAAISSLPYTPEQSMTALKFYYFILGDKLWKEYGFVDAFSLYQLWYADSFLAIDQGQIIIMTENYRSGLLWNLFMSCPEVKALCLTKSKATTCHANAHSKSFTTVHDEKNHHHFFSICLLNFNCAKTNDHIAGDSCCGHRQKFI